ncbi:3-ketosteroid-9-alpha-hydroxylase reductase subunit [Rhodobacteraceae bacterium THAF1]|uniref:hybrid-cluster NAD(P)-dependent oxidoreductase n=1 Tax=Palleronia sp. THAF1 TaxID=2587842 RepID=UPI000F3D6F3E|nr:hybrid-cluster NAD(P)-dependent oxidoreductase [Palleronia sp. THAF1]QFU07692.1 3-ketosteroid-9-alpha-hydroxylase reductase subunit [Palleronia sp. THAF1]VDC23148.1 3-ketosteroid-9-alpha-hydroxylase reductase subunit [Rhodobacteraceae bacterium THAF1]
MIEVWTDEEALECTMVVPEAPNVRTFAFRAPSGRLFDYRPGQFVTLELPVPGGPIHRTYSISSSPSRPLALSVTVKAQEGSVGTRWMFDHVNVGTRIKASGPAGSFTLGPTDRKYLLISAGSGITPMMSMLSYLYDYGTDPDVRLIACARRPTDLVFPQTLTHMAGRVPGLKLSFAVTEEEPYQVWTGYMGRLNQLMLGTMAPDYLERDVYCCGPEPFMQMVREALSYMGYDMARFRQESFAAPAPVAEVVPDDDVVPDAAASAQVTFARAGVTLDCRETDTILALSRANALRIPYGCTFGICGTCKVRKTKGEVRMVHNGGISDDDVADGWILTCCSHPVGEVEIDA